MDLRRLRRGEWLIALSSAAMIVSPFLDWYSVALCIQSVVDACPERTGWESLTRVDVVLTVGGIAGLVVVALTAVARSPAPGIAADGLLALLALVLLIPVLVRFLRPPDGLDREIGQWIGLAGSVFLLVGAVLAMRDERLSKPGRPSDSTGRPAPPPDIPVVQPPKT